MPRAASNSWFGVHGLLLPWLNAAQCRIQPDSIVWSCGRRQGFAAPGFALTMYYAGAVYRHPNSVSVFNQSTILGYMFASFTLNLAKIYDFKLQARVYAVTM